MGAPSDYRVQAALVAAEIGDRRVLARSAVALAATLTGVALIFLFEGDRGSSEAVRFAVAVTAAGVLALVAGLLWHEARQLSYLRSFHRLFIEPYIPARDLTELRKHPSTGRPGTFIRELPALVATVLAGVVALTIVWVGEGPPGTARDAAVYICLGLAAILAVGVLLDESGRWDTRLEQLAKGIAKMRSKELEVVFVDKVGVLKREAGCLCVKYPTELPDANLIAAAYFSPEAAKLEPDQADGWHRFKSDPDESQLTHEGGADDTLVPSIPARFGPSIAVVVGCAAVLFLVLSVLAGPPAALPGWAFDSAAIYVGARAAVVALVLFVLVNLLVNLASGRLLSSVSQSGLAFAGPSTDELVSIDKKTSAAVDDLRDRQDALQSDTTAISVAFEALVEKVAELEAAVDDGEDENG